MTKTEILNEAEISLKKLYSEYKTKGILSIYLWGSIITPDFNIKTSDIDSVAILSNEADLDELMKIREWLPKSNPKLVRLQINFFYLNDLIGTKPEFNKTFRPSTPKQAAFDFPNWVFICGEKINKNELKQVTPNEFLKDQLEIVKVRETWAKTPTTKLDQQYYCKSLIWLCYAIHKLKHPKNCFSWKLLLNEANEDTVSLIQLLNDLKTKEWDSQEIKKSLPILYKNAELLVKIYS